MKTSLEHLAALCALPPDFNALTPQADPRNARVRYILQALGAMGVQYEVDCFDATGRHSGGADIPRFINIAASVPGRDTESNDSIVFLAHHDVLVPAYQNVNDNTASCANLLNLLQRLLVNAPARRRTYVVFTDAEEIVSTTRSGARQLARRIHQGDFGNVQYCVNLELTALGRALYCDRKLPGLAEAAGVPVPVIATPFSDATTLRYWGLPATVLGTLPPHELADLEGKRWGGCRTWARCHQPTDTLELASASDMARFVDVLERIAHSSSSAVNKVLTVPKVR
jgi:hypothetical protein